MDKDAQQMIAFGMMFCLICYGVSSCAIRLKKADQEQIELAHIKEVKQMVALGFKENK
jgi:hypothetical protein